MEVSGSKLEAAIEVSSAVGFAALVAAAAYGIWKAAEKFSKIVKEGHEEVDQAWTGWLENTAEASENAMAFAEAYEKAQQKAEDAIYEGGVIQDALADKWVDRSRVINAEGEELVRAMSHAATDYEELLAAVMSINEDLEAYEKPIALPTPEEYRRYREEPITGAPPTGSLAPILGDIQDLARQMVELATEAGGAEEAVEGLEGGLYQMPEAVAVLTEEEVEAAKLHAQYLQEEADAISKLNNELADALDDLESDISEIGAGFEEKRWALIARLTEEASQREEEYYRKREELAAKYNLGVQRAEEDHRVRMARLREDSLTRQKDAISNRDALALRKERASYRQTRDRAEEDYQRQARRKSEDFVRQLVQMEAALHQQEAKRVADYEKQLIELGEQEAKEKEERIAAYDERVAELEEANADELAELEQSHFDKLNAATGYYSVSKADQGRYHRGMLRDAHTFLAAHRQKWIDYIRSLPVPSSGGGYAIPGTPGRGRKGGVRASGGGIPWTGDYRLHRGEYVLDPPTTQALGGALGGLSQEKILAGILGAGGAQHRGGGMSLHQEFVFHGRLTLEEKEQYREIATAASWKAMEWLVGEMD